MVERLVNGEGHKTGAKINLQRAVQRQADDGIGRVVGKVAVAVAGRQDAGVEDPDPPVIVVHATHAGVVALVHRESSVAGHWRVVDVGNGEGHRAARAAGYLSLVDGQRVGAVVDGDEALLADRRRSRQHVTHLHNAAVAQVDGNRVAAQFGVGAVEVGNLAIFDVQRRKTAALSQCNPGGSIPAAQVATERSAFQDIGQGSRIGIGIFVLQIGHRQLDGVGRAVQVEVVQAAGGAFFHQAAAVRIAL
ncbi:MAG: hypothetical protein AW10_00313 [Candidatus Accumulibacter appositus]|uniref:Uncharacterized protein n=1 Tax=Candidatus Accumulibacter appositus TaxID=1454003 RepID=A0A011NJB2_9PROT|nr:MAG: hypothetical protein AW10_00313 [Candidatus Accumulibacter appositus]